MQFHILDDIQVLTDYLPDKKWYPQYWYRFVNGHSVPYSIAEVVVSPRRELLKSPQLGSKAISRVEEFLDQNGLGIGLPEFKIIDWVNKYMRSSESERFVTSRIDFEKPISHLLEIVKDTTDRITIKNDIKEFGDVSLYKFLTMERSSPNDYHNIRFLSKYYLRYNMSDIEFSVWSTIYHKDKSNILNVPSKLMEVVTDYGHTLLVKEAVTAIKENSTDVTIYLNTGEKIITTESYLSVISKFIGNENKAI